MSEQEVRRVLYFEFPIPKRILDRCFAQLLKDGFPFEEINYRVAHRYNKEFKPVRTLVLLDSDTIYETLLPVNETVSESSSITYEELSASDKLCYQELEKEAAQTPSGWQKDIIETTMQDLLTITKNTNKQYYKYYLPYFHKSDINKEELKAILDIYPKAMNSEGYIQPLAEVCRYYSPPVGKTGSLICTPINWNINNNDMRKIKKSFDLCCTCPDKDYPRVSKKITKKNTTLLQIEFEDGHDGIRALAFQRDQHFVDSRNNERILRWTYVF